MIWVITLVNLHFMCGIYFVMKRARYCCHYCHFLPVYLKYNLFTRANNIACSASGEHSWKCHIHPSAIIDNISPPNNVQQNPLHMMWEYIKPYTYRPQSHISCPKGRQLLVSIVARLWPLNICSWNVLCYSKFVMNTTQLNHWGSSLRRFPGIA